MPHPVRLGENPSPIDVFIAEMIEPQREKLNAWEETLSHMHLLYHAAKRARIRSRRFTATHHILFHSGLAIGGIDDGITSLVSHQARRVCQSKALTQRYLKASGVSVPRGKTLHQSQFNSAVQHWERLRSAAVVKPSHGTGGRGVHKDIRTLHQLENAWASAGNSSSAQSADKQILLEASCSGVDIRAFVVGEEVTAAVARVPFYVVGDGRSTIGELADQEIGRRRKSPYLAQRTPEVTDEFLRPMKVDRQTMVSRGKIQQLTPIPDISEGGGLVVDVTDVLDDALKETSVSALWAIPGLGAAAVDLLAPSLQSAEESVVLEVSPEANLSEFRHPDYGEFRRPQWAIMEQILRQGPQ